MSVTSTATFDALVEFVRTMRPEWQTPGIRKAIVHTLDQPKPPSLADLTYALVRLATNPSIGTPWVLTYDGPHWRKQTEAARQIEAKVCQSCHGLHTPTAPCVSSQVTPPERQAEFIAHARALVAERTRHLCQHGPGCRECSITNETEGDQ